MEQKRVKEIIKKNKNAKFPSGICCANRCADCRYMEMDNDAYNDGTRRCAYYGRWMRPSSAACSNFSY